MHYTHDPKQVRTAILTLSDTRTEADDKSGSLIRELLSQQLHEVAAYKIIPDDANRLTSVMLEWTKQEKIDAIICNGGTGMSKRDITYNTTSSLLEKEMVGFGELFRQKSYAEVGARAMLGNAIAGTMNGTAVFALPGSSNAVKLAMNELILPILPHFVGELNK